MDKPPKQKLTHRILIALLCGVVVFCVLNVAAWYNLRGEGNVCRRQMYTRAHLGFIEDAIPEYQKEHGSLPASLRDLSDLDKRGFELTVDGRPLDEWGHPIRYEVTEDICNVYSLGRDGQPGGVGLDAELYHDYRNQDAALPTFRQYFLEKDSAEVDRSGFTMAALMAGVGTVFIAMRSISDFSGSRLVPLLTYAGVIVVMACLIGTLLLPIHIPTGH